MKPKFIDNPFDLLLDAFNALYPDKYAEIYWTDKETLQADSGQKGALGITNYADEDRPTTDILICADQTMVEAMDVLAHELAHVAVGFDAAHGEEFQSAYKAIFEKYDSDLTVKEA